MEGETMAWLKEAVTMDVAGVILLCVTMALIGAYIGWWVTRRFGGRGEA